MRRPRPPRLRAALSVGATVAMTGAMLTLPAGTAHAAFTSSGNLLSGDAAGFNLGLDNWSGYAGATLSLATALPHTGAGAMAVTAPNGGTVGAMSAPAPAVPGGHYAAASWVKAADAGRPAYMLLAFYDSTGHVIAGSDEWGQPATDSGSWQRLMPVAGIAPANAATVRTFVLFNGTAAGETHYVDDAVLNEAVGTATDVVGPLSTQGNQIVDGNGNPVVLRGIHREGTQKASYAPITQSEVQHAKDWGANYLRIPIAEDRYIGGTCYSDPSYPSMIDQVVNWTTQRGMVALLDLHYNTITSCGALEQQPMADRNALTFWKQVASRYKDNGLVAFDLYNEPHGISDSVWRSGGNVTWNGVTYRAVGMQNMYDAVRKAKAQNLVFVTGNVWGNSWPSTAPLQGYNIVYAAHAYTCPTATPANGGTCATSTPYDPGVILDNFLPAAQSHPVAITEFGWPDATDGIYYRNVINYAEAHGWSWDAFAWDGGTSGLFSLLTDVGPTYEPTAAGMAVLIGLAKN